MKSRSTAGYSRESAKQPTIQLRPKLFIILLISCLFFGIIGIIYGAAMVGWQLFPYGLVEELYTNYRELRENWRMYIKQRPTEHLEPSRHEGRGVVVNEASAAQPGLTLLSGLFDDRGSSVRLMESDGQVVEQWETKYSKIWPDPRHLEEVPFNDWFADIHGLVLLPDHSIVFNFEYLGLSRVDRCGNVMWKIPRMTHHAVFLAENNTLWAPVAKYHTERSADFPNIVPPFNEDSLIQVSLDGEILREISVLGLIYENRMEGLLPTGRRETEISYQEPLHLNDVEVLSAEQAAAFASFEPGVVMVSMRVPNLVLIFEPDSGKIIWHQTGPWLRQHDPDFRDDGQISVFDNRGVEDDDAVFGGSRILLVDPISHVTRYAYPHGEANHFFTPTRGRHQNLDNGNMLVVETAGGRVLEIAKDGRIVWSYLNRYDQSSVGKIQEAIRYPNGYLDPSPKACNQ
jgi:Arylsulfotransferase (ASST)